MESASSGGAVCAQCGVKQPKENFSKKQWGLKADVRKCTSCVSAPPTSEKAAVSIEVEQSEKVATIPQEPVCQAGEVKTNGGYGTSEKLAPEGSGADCAGCGVRMAKDNFSKKQWASKESRTCKTCVGVSEPEKAGKKSTKVDLTKMVCEQLSNPAQYFQSAERTQAWWAQYQEGFQEEQKWMVAQGKESGFLGMAPSGETMANIIFSTVTTGFTKKICFCARNAADETAFAFAFVDVPADHEQPCSLRLLHVDPKRQRQGVGSALLKMIVSHFGKMKRHLGVKFARVHDQEKFFKNVGFQQIGIDEVYVYMARKVIMIPRR